MPRRGDILYYIITAAVFIILETAAVVLVVYNGPLQNTWMMKGVHGFMGNVWGRTERVADYFSLKKENERLSQLNTVLFQRLKAYELDTVVMSGFGEPSVIGNFEYLPAEIIKSSNNRQHNYMIISKGSKDGVRPMSGIITSKGALGIINSVSEHYSFAYAFNSSDMILSARLGREGAVGTMVWDGYSSKGAVLNEIPHHIDVAEGDTVYTSGFSTIFPPDIPLGVTGKKRLVNGASWSINVEMFEDFRKLRYVMIVGCLDSAELEELEELEEQMEP